MLSRKFIYTGFVKIAELLIKTGANIDNTNNNGESILFEIIKKSIYSILYTHPQTNTFVAVVAEKFLINKRKKIYSQAIYSCIYALSEDLNHCRCGMASNGFRFRNQ